MPYKEDVSLRWVFLRSGYYSLIDFAFVVHDVVDLHSHSIFSFYSLLPPSPVKSRALSFVFSIWRSVFRRFMSGYNASPYLLGVMRPLDYKYLDVHTRVPIDTLSFYLSI
jgi:hypothetical protein